MRDPFEVDPNDGKVTIYEKRSGKPRKMWPVDAREVLATSDYYTVDLPAKVKERLEKEGGDEVSAGALDPDKEHLVGITGGNTPMPPEQSSSGKAAVREVPKSSVAEETENPFDARSLVRMANDARAEKEAAKADAKDSGGKASGGSGATSTKSGATATSDRNKEGVTREDLDKMSKAEIVALAERNRVQISATTMTSEQIKNEVAKKLEL